MKMKGFKIFSSLQRTIFYFILALIILPTTTVGILSYNQYAESITEKIRILNMNNIAQIGSNMEDIFHNLQNNSLAFFQNDMVRNYLLSKDKSNLWKYTAQLDRFILNKLAYEEYIKAVDIRRMDGSQYNSSVTVKGINDGLNKELLDQKGRSMFVRDIPQKYKDTNMDLFGYARAVNDINDIGTPIGTMQLYIDQADILDLLSNNQLDESNVYYIVENGAAIISPEKNQVGKSIYDILGKINLSKKQDCTTIGLNGGKQMLTYYHLDYPDWYLIHIVPLNQINKEQSLVRQIIGFMIVLSILICSLMAYLLAKSVIKPLRRVAGSMKDIEQENFRIKIPEAGYEEITVLAHAFNKMSERLDELVNKIYAAEIKERDAQIKAMQAYINPHFLYNTLDTICWMSRMENAYETCNLIEALSKLFRLSVQNIEKTTTVLMELEHIKSYIEIQQCRYTGTIDFILEIDEAVLNYETVRFVLQPLVENAILHGIEPSGENGSITIIIKEDEDRLVYLVKNDGMDADIAEMEELLKNYNGDLRGLGICSINDRIRLCYGGEYGLRFMKNQPHGLQVMVLQPARLSGQMGGKLDNGNDCG